MSQIKSIDEIPEMIEIMIERWFDPQLVEDKYKIAFANFVLEYAAQFKAPISEGEVEKAFKTWRDNTAAAMHHPFVAWKDAIHWLQSHPTSSGSGEEGMIKIGVKVYDMLIDENERLTAELQTLKAGNSKVVPLDLVDKWMRRLGDSMDHGSRGPAITGVLEEYEQICETLYSSPETLEDDKYSKGYLQGINDSATKPLHQKIETQQSLIHAQEEYIKWLEETRFMPYPDAPDLRQKGIEHRSKIEGLKKNLK